MDGLGEAEPSLRPAVCVLRFDAGTTRLSILLASGGTDAARLNCGHDAGTGGRGLRMAPIAEMALIWVSFELELRSRVKVLRGDLMINIEMLTTIW